MESLEIVIGGKRIKVKSDNIINLNKNKEKVESLYNDLLTDLRGVVDRESLFLFITFKLLDEQEIYYSSLINNNFDFLHCMLDEIDKEEKR